MSFREINMLEIREVLRRWTAGQAARAIARETGVDRKTVGRYAGAASEAGLERGGEVTDAIIAEVSRRVQDRPLPDPSAPWNRLAAVRPRIEHWLGNAPPLRLVRIHELLAGDGVHVSYTTLRRYAHRELGWHERPPTIRIDDGAPGDEAQVDFGLVGRLRDADGKLRKLWVLVVTLTKSRYMFVWPTFLQTTAALCEGLDEAWRFFGGMPRRLILDNMSAAVKKADDLSPVLNKSFLEYLQTRGLLADLARVRHPKDKARVENQVPFVRERWFQGATFHDLVDARATAETWCREIAGTRVHGTTRRVPRDVYETEERPHMLAAPVARFEVPAWKGAVKIHPDHHIQVAGALYSVPWSYEGEVDARVDSVTVQIWRSSSVIKVHPRQPPGGRSTDPRDYPPAKEPWALRNIDAVRAQGKKEGAHVGRFVDRLLDGPLPWTRMRRAYGLLRLCKRYGRARVDALCARALAFEMLDVRRVERMLKTAQKVEDAAEAKGKLIALPARFARDSASFTTHTAGDEEGGAR